MFAIVDAYRAGLLKTHNWWRNIMSGIIVGIVALPLSMAFAIASGVKPEQGLYTAIIAGLIVGIFGGSRIQIAGPTGAFIVILANITAEYGVDGLQIATLIAGFILLFMGLLRLGTVIKFIPDPVIVGFTAGIGVIIFVGQWKDFFGLPVQLPLNAHFTHKVFALFSALPQMSLYSAGLGLLSLLLALFVPKFFKRLPGPLIAMCAATLIQYYFDLPGITTIGSLFGGIPDQLPQFHLPELTLDDVRSLIGPAFTVAMLGAIESLLSATAADGMAGTRHHSNAELIGQGLANIVAPLFGGFAATGAIARTATNVRNGGNSPIAAIVHSIFLVLVIILLAPLAAYIPLCALAAILFIVAYNMSDLPHFFHIMLHAPKTDIFVLMATFLLTVFTDLVVAVNVGVILAMFFFIHQMILSVDVDAESEETLKPELTADGIHGLPSDLLVYTIQGPFFFGAAEKLEHALAVTHTDPKTIIIRLKYVPFMDMTGLSTFSEIIEEYRKRGVTVLLCEAKPSIRQKLEKLGILDMVHKEHVYATLADAVKSCR